MLTVILAMHFYVHTTYGVSSAYFSTSANLLILGVLQGSGTAPCIWMCVSNALLQALSSLSAGFSAHCPQEGILTSSRPGETFVDDTDLWLTSDTSSDSNLVLSTMNTQHWERLLFSRGPKRVSNSMLKCIRPFAQ